MKNSLTPRRPTLMTASWQRDEVTGRLRMSWRSDRPAARV